MTAIDSVLEACRLMGVPFSVCDGRPAGYTYGPAAGGCHPDLGVYLLREDMDSGDAWAWALHELSHVVWWDTDDGAEVDEEPLIAWEYAVSRHFNITNFWACQYTATTQIWVADRGREVGEWVRPQRSAWFARARQECVRRGALTPDFRPTWKRPIFRLDEHDNGWDAL